METPVARRAFSGTNKRLLGRTPEIHTLLRCDTDDTIDVLIEQEPVLNETGSGTGDGTDVGAMILVPFLQR